MKYRVQIDCVIEIDVEANSFLDAAEKVEGKPKLGFQFSQHIKDTGKDWNAECMDWTAAAIIKL